MATAVKNWPTPVASMAKGSSPGSLTRRSGANRSNDRLDHAVMASDGGQLNPEWVEVMMGWPRFWTDLSPLPMGEMESWLKGFSSEIKGNRYGKTAWSSGDWENGIARVVNKMTSRSDRIKALGNGQVPKTAATAFSILNRD